jgi:hypothetical protein
MVELKAPMLRVPDVAALVGLLLDEGLIVPTGEACIPKVARLSLKVQGSAEKEDRSPPVAPILQFFKTMLADGWAREASVQITAADVVRVLNGGETGTYHQPCVRQFMRPFMRDGSVVGFTWNALGPTREKYVVDIARVTAFLAELPV